MKAIMISIKPKWMAKILNGKKTIEVRKSKSLANAIQKLIDENGYADIYVYCTKDKHYLFESDWSDNEGRCCVVQNELNKAIEYVKSQPCYGKEQIGCPFVLYGTPYGNLLEKRKYYSGKVVAKFRCYKVEELPFSKRQKQWANNELAFGCQLTYIEFCDYLQYKTGYAIHISNLEIFDKPKELSEFYVRNPKGDVKLPELRGKHHLLAMKQLTKAPQSWCYVYVEVE